MDGTSPETVDELVRVPANPVRRAVLRHFAASPSETTLAELAGIVVDAEADSETALRDLRIALHHQHLPKLEAAGLLTYDPDHGRVTPTVYEQACSRRWQTVSAIDSVISLAESDASSADAGRSEGQCSAN